MKRLLTVYRHRFQLTLVTCLIILVVAWFVKGPQINSDTNWTEATNSGDIIVLALGAYQTKNGYYPVSLKHLIPEYLHALPRVKLGTKNWLYKVDESKQSYLLYVRLASDNSTSLAYESRTGEWHFLNIQISMDE